MILATISLLCIAQSLQLSAESTHDKTVNATPTPAAGWTSQVDSARLYGDVTQLCRFGTRHTLSATDSKDRGIGAARNWMKESLEKSGVSNVTLESFEVPPSVRVPDGATIVNVVAVVPGSDPIASRRAYYVVGHYDSRNTDAMDAAGDAPGANDDASGTAVVMELARIVASKPLESTVIFLATAGEEQGLLGAKAHAQSMAASKKYTISGVLSNDIVGDPAARADLDNIWPAGVNPTPEQRAAAQGPDPRTVVRIFSEGVPRNQSASEAALSRALSTANDSESRQLARYIAYVAEIESTTLKPILIFRPDRFLRGGDHSAFNEVGLSAVRFTTLNEDYSRQHVNISTKDGKPYGDIPEFVDAAYLASVAQLNLAALVHLANAPRVPGNITIDTLKLAATTTVKWDASPETDVAGYEVVWRSTTQPMWEHSVDVGQARNITLPISKDDYFFGVRAYDRDGFRSPAGFAR